MRKLQLILISTFLFLTVLYNSQIVYGEEKEIDVSYKDIRIILDEHILNPTNAKGEKVEPFIYNGTTYLPIRAIAEALSLSVEWNSTTSTIIMTKKNINEEEKDNSETSGTIDDSNSIESSDVANTSESTGEIKGKGDTAIGSDSQNDVKTRWEHIFVSINKINIELEGNTLELKDANGVLVEPLIYEGTTYLPVRAIGSSLKKNVEWDSISATVYLTSE